MVWILGSRIIFLVTGHAVRREPGIGSVDMALVAILDIMTKGQREKVVIAKICRGPSRVGGMTGHTIGRKPTGCMVWILCARIIILMATHTIGRCIGIISRSMALCTVLDIMSFGQRKKIVVDTFRIPAKTQWIVTFYTVSRESCGLVVGVLRTCVVILMATDTFITDPIETQCGFGGVAFHTAQVAMCAD